MSKYNTDKPNKSNKSNKSKDKKKKDKSTGDYQKFTNAELADYSLPEDSFCLHASENASAGLDLRKKASWSRHDLEKKDHTNAIPHDHVGITLTVQAIYKRISIVRTVIDMMADFASDGLDIQHPIASQEKFYKLWAKKVDLIQRAHDYMKLLLRDGNIIVRSKFAKLSPKLVTQMTNAFHGHHGHHRHHGHFSLHDDFNLLHFTVLDEDVNEKPVIVDINKIDDSNKRTIPWQYVFISPAAVRKIAGPVGNFYGSKDIGIKLDNRLIQSIRNPRNDQEKKSIEKLPQEILNAVNNSKVSSNIIIRLDPRYTWVDYYKKDDWENWATPFLYSVLDDLLFKSKLRSADLAALDGVINVIRLWKLGSSKDKILPTPNATSKLLDILQNNVGGGALDIVWNDMIDLSVEYPPLDKLLCPDKYINVDKDILQGLGIPAALLNPSTRSSNVNAQVAFMQLKTLIEKLEYVRDRCVKWINSQFEIIKTAMGWKNIPFVSFSTVSLRDEVGEKKLLLQMIDRELVSVETVEKMFGFNFSMELRNMRSEEKIRKEADPVLEKTGPFNQPKSVLEFQRETQLEVGGLNLPDSGNPPPNQPSKKIPDNKGGRPRGTPDSQQRKSRTDKTLAQKIVYKYLVVELMDKIDEIVDSRFLKHCELKDKRNLTISQTKSLEDTKWHILTSLPHNIDLNNITDKMLLEYSKNNSNFSKYNKEYKEVLNELKKCNKNITLNDRRNLMIDIWLQNQFR